MSWPSSSVKDTDVGIDIVKIEQTPPTGFNTVSISKGSPTREIEIGSDCLVGDNNPDMVLGLGELEEGEFKCPDPKNDSPDMFQELMPCTVGDGLSIVIRNKQLYRHLWNDTMNNIRDQTQHVELKYTVIASKFSH